MSFSGDLEHLPITDVVQLLHSSRKSGILRVNCRKGESHLVFKDGYIVSASHLNGSLRIGQVLIDLGLIRQETLQQALAEQETAGAARKPLVVTLIEKGLIREEDAYRGLERLIETTLVEILTWTRGRFTLDVLPENVSDRFGYYPEKMNLEINVDTQSVLMDALRVYDEKVRDGELSGSDESVEMSLTADDLGLGELDKLERKIPKAFNLEQIDPGEKQRRIVKEWLPGMKPEEQESVLSYLTEARSERPAGEPRYRVILLSRDTALQKLVEILCAAEGCAVVPVRDIPGLETVVAEAGFSASVLLLDGSVPENEQEDSPALRKLVAELPVVRLVNGGKGAAAWRGYQDGAASVLISPERSGATSGADAMDFLKALRSCLGRLFFLAGSGSTGRMRDSLIAMREAKDGREVARLLLDFLSSRFPRSIMFVVRQKELIAEHSVGVPSGDRLRKKSIPLEDASVAARVAGSGTFHFGDADEMIQRQIHHEVGAPARPVMLLLPIRNGGRTVAVAYADFADREPAPVDRSLLELMVLQTEMALDIVLSRRKNGRP